MNEMSPAVQAIVLELSAAVRRDHIRRRRRLRLIRLALLGVLVLAGASTAALAAGGVFHQVETVEPQAEVELPKDVTIQAVDSYPEFVGLKTRSGFQTVNAGPKGAPFIYHVTGGEARELGCGYPQVPTNNIYITSTRELSEQEVEALLLPDGQLKPLTKPPPWITSTSDGCPNPGLGGQPATPDEKLEPGKAAVATPASKSTRVLVRHTVTVPGPAPSQGSSTQSPPSSGAPSPQSSSGSGSTASSGSGSTAAEGGNLGASTP